MRWYRPSADTAMYLLKLAMLTLMLGSQAQARDWYLSPAGNDAAAGSEAQPLRSISRLLDPALGLLNAGDRLILRGPAGNALFAESELRLRLPLTLMAYPGESPRIECPLTLADGVCVQIDPEASGSVLRGLDIAGGNLYGVFLQTAWEQVGAPNGVGASNILIEDCRIHDSGRDAIKVTPKSNNLTIRRSEIFNTGRIYGPGTPLEDRNAEGIDNVQGHGMRVQDSHIHDTSTNGIYFKGGATDVVIERNRIERTGEAGILVGFDTSPEFFDLTQNPQYYEAVRGVVRNNIVRDTAYAGIGLYASRDALVANNTLIDTARVGHAALYFGVTLQDFDPIAGRPSNLNPRLLNNLIQRNDSAGACVAIRFANELGGLSGLAGNSGIDFSLYSHATGCRFFDQRPGSVLAEGGSFDQWRQASGSDAHSIAAATTLSADGHLTSASPAIDAGSVVAEVSDDIDLQLRTPPYDIGADESGAAAGPGAIAISGTQSGTWFDPERDGEGFLLEIGTAGSTRRFVASWYTYRNGQQLWLVGSAVLAAGATQVSVPLVVTRGANFGSAFRPGDVIVEPWGTATFSFPACARMQVSYAPLDGVSGVLQLQRILDGIEGLRCP